MLVGPVHRLLCVLCVLRVLHGLGMLWVLWVLRVLRWHLQLAVLLAGHHIRSLLLRKEMLCCGSALDLH